MDPLSHLSANHCCFVLIRHHNLIFMTWQSPPSRILSPNQHCDLSTDETPKRRIFARGGGPVHCLYWFSKMLIVSKKCSHKPWVCCILFYCQNLNDRNWQLCKKWKKKAFLFFLTAIAPTFLCFLREPALQLFKYTHNVSKMSWTYCSVDKCMG